MNTTMNDRAFAAKAAGASRLMKSLANAHRLMILCRLHKGECSVGEMEALLGIKQSALSQHLARLRKDGIVATRRESQTIYYRLADPVAGRVVKNLYDLYCCRAACSACTKRKGKVP